MFKRQKSAFTMIELVFVIVVIGVLAAIAVPKFTASSKEAKELAAQENIKTLINNLREYAISYGGLSAKFSDMTQVPLRSEDKGSDIAVASFDYNGKDCLQLNLLSKGKKTSGKMLITAKNSASPECVQLLSKAQTINILSTDYTCAQGMKTDQSKSSSRPVVWHAVGKGAKVKGADIDKLVGMNDKCTDPAEAERQFGVRPGGGSAAYLQYRMSIKSPGDRIILDFTKDLDEFAF